MAGRRFRPAIPGRGLDAEPLLRVAIAANTQMRSLVRALPSVLLEKATRSAVRSKKQNSGSMNWATSEGGIGSGGAGGGGSNWPNPLP